MENKIMASSFIIRLRDNPIRIFLPNTLLNKNEITKKKHTTIESNINLLRNNNKNDSFFN